MKPDELNNWIKRQVENNPVEPPEAAWEQISENLELEDAWQNINKDLELDNLWTTIDGRLQLYTQMLWWERAGTVVASIMAGIALCLPLLWTAPQAESTLANNSTSNHSEQVDAEAAGLKEEIRAESALAIQEKKRSKIQANQASAGLLKINADGHFRYSPIATESAEIASTAGGRSRKSSVISEDKYAFSQSGFFRNVDGKRVASLAPEVDHRETAATVIQEQKNPVFKRIEGLTASLSLQKGFLKLPEHVGASTTEADKGVILHQRKSATRGNWLVGAGASARMSWLLNQKTLRAMEKSALTTALPAYRKSFYLQAEHVLSPRLAFLSELVVLSETGQRYMEYQQGIYGETNTSLNYHQLSLLAAFSPRGFIQSHRPHARLLAGLSGGWLREANFEGPYGTVEVTSEYKKTSTALILGYEYNLPLAARLRMAYSIRGYVDIFSIDGESVEMPAEFRNTRNSYLDFTIGFKYDLMKK